VKLSIYNANGQLVRVLVDDVLGAGRRSVTWNGTDRRQAPVSSGIYFYRLTIPGRTQSRKMVLLR
jgi:flagellar hook assembly protein FlgD